MLFAMLLSSVTWQFLARLSQSLNSCAFCSLRIPTRILTEFISKSEILIGLTHPFDLLLLLKSESLFGEHKVPGGAAWGKAADAWATVQEAEIARLCLQEQE